MSNQEFVSENFELKSGIAALVAKAWLLHPAFESVFRIRSPNYTPFTLPGSYSVV